jgi:hypothetical protein
MEGLLYRYGNTVDTDGSNVRKYGRLTEVSISGSDMYFRTSEIDRIRKLFYVYSTCTVHVTCTLYTYTYGSRKYFRKYESTCTSVLPYLRTKVLAPRGVSFEVRKCKSVITCALICIALLPGSRSCTRF